MKVFGGGQLLNADFGLKMVGKEMYRIEIGCLFLGSFLLGKQKKGERGHATNRHTVQHRVVNPQDAFILIYPY